MSPTVKAVIFDMDGVLIDAREWHYEALNRALALLGWEISRYDHLCTYDGLPTRRKLEMLTAERGLPVELHGFLNELKQQYTMEYVATRCRPVFQHEFALARLRAAGFRLAVASNSIRTTVQAMMEHASLIDYLDAVLSSDDVVDPKPSPDIYLMAMQRLGVRPEETLILEDNENGIRAARASGANVLVVGSPEDVTFEAILDRVRTCEAPRVEMVA
jgi:beta-phosphoglucomutase